MPQLPRREFLQNLTAAALAVPAVVGGAEPPSKPRRRIKVGQIGVGHAHATKLSVYRESADYEVVGIVEADPQLQAQAKAQPVYRDLPWMTREQLLNVAGLEVVLVETRVPDLLDTAEACVAAGQNIHLDKPAGSSLPQFRRIMAAAERQKLLVQMGYMYRYNPGVVRLREWLRAGWLGELFEVHAVMSKLVPPVERTRLVSIGGHMMFELGCHLIDLIVGLLGKPTAVTAYAQHVSRVEDALWDNTLAVLTYPRALATVKATAVEVDGGERRHLVACGSEGTFHIQPLDNPQARATLSKARGEFPKGYQDLSFPKYVRYVDDAADMARVLRGEKSSDFSYQHDLDVQETILRACNLPLDG